MSDLVEKVARAIIENISVPNAASRAAIAVLLKTQIGYVRDGDDHTDDFKEVFEDTVRDFARENGVSLDE